MSQDPAAAAYVERIRSNPKYQELVAKRTGFALTLSIIMLVIYYGFVLVVAFAPWILAIKVYGPISLGIPVGVIIILSAFVLTGIYTFRANGEFDELTRQIKQQQ